MSGPKEVKIAHMDLAGFDAKKSNFLKNPMSLKQGFSTFLIPRPPIVVNNIQRPHPHS